MDPNPKLGFYKPMFLSFRDANWTMIWQNFINKYYHYSLLSSDKDREITKSFMFKLSGSYAQKS